MEKKIVYPFRNIFYNKFEIKNSWIHYKWCVESFICYNAFLLFPKFSDFTPWFYFPNTPKRKHGRMMRNETHEGGELNSLQVAMWWPAYGIFALDVYQLCYLKLLCVLKMAWTKLSVSLENQEIVSIEFITYINWRYQ